MQKNVLVTGGCGYIGTHTIVLLLQAGYTVTVADSLVNSNLKALDRVKEIVGCHSTKLKYFKVDLRIPEQIDVVFQSSDPFSACIHFAGLKAVGESTVLPLLYYGT